VNLAFRCRKVVFEWEKLGLESFRNDTSVYIYAHLSLTTQIQTQLLILHLNNWLWDMHMNTYIQPFKQPSSFVDPHGWYFVFWQCYVFSAF